MESAYWKYGPIWCGVCERSRFLAPNEAASSIAKPFLGSVCPKEGAPCFWIHAQKLDWIALHVRMKGGGSGEGSPSLALPKGVYRTMFSPVEEILWGGQADVRHMIFLTVANINEKVGVSYLHYPRSSQPPLSKPLSGHKTGSGWGVKWNSSLLWAIPILPVRPSSVSAR